VSEGAQVLTFGASAEVTLSNGETCSVNTPASLVRAKGYKHAIPEGGAASYGSYPIGLRLDAQTPGAGGYVEQIILSREGIDLVFACYLQDNVPEELLAAQSDADRFAVHYALFIRPSQITSPGIAPIGSWVRTVATNAGQQQMVNVELVSHHTIMFDSSN
jgi:hypothetical protein